MHTQTHMPAHRYVHKHMWHDHTLTTRAFLNTRCDGYKLTPLEIIILKDQIVLFLLILK